MKRQVAIKVFPRSLLYVGMPGSITNWIIGAGIALIIVGLIAKTGVLNWFGQLPGDIHIEREGFQFYFSLMSMILISVGLSALVAVVRRFFR